MPTKQPSASIRRVLSLLAYATLTILTVSCTVNTGGAVSHEPFEPAGPPATEAAQGLCEALRPEFPIPFHGGASMMGRGYAGQDPSADRADTVLRIKRINARFKAVCP